MNVKTLWVWFGVYLWIGLLSAEPLSNRIVQYDIRARLDPASHTLEGEETITYRHEGHNELPALQFHLYWNAFRNARSTFQRELAVASRDYHFDEQRAGWTDITSVRLADGAELTPLLRYLHPDDHNEEDRTVAEVRLPAPVLPGSTISIQVTFRACFPEMAPRAGYRHDFFMAGQWFPKLGVLQNDMWVTHQYHASSEFFSNFGVYTVALTLPRRFVVAASGDLLSENAQGDSKTVSYRAEDVHDFAWAAWPRFRRVEERWRNVRLELYHAPEHLGARRHLEAARGALEWLDRRLGPYPYPRLVIVDVPAWAEPAAGMEYPTLVTTTMEWWTPRFLREPELITIHEVGHQYFYGMLANNESEEAWLDEGINTYVEANIADSLYGSQHSGIALPVLHASDATLSWRPRFVRAPPTDAVLEPSWRYWSPRAYGATSYSKSLYMLQTVEQLVGRETLWNGLRAYFERWRFRHPSTRDFLDSLRETSGQDLDWFWNQALYAPSTLDYAIEEVKSEKLGERSYLHHIRVRRLGDLTMPAEMTARLADSTIKKRFWDGRARWYDFALEAPADFDWAEINAQPLETNRVNNSYGRGPWRAAAAKLAGLWTFLVQHVLEMAAWLV